MLEKARAILSIIDKYDCSDISAYGDGGKCFLAEKEEFLSGKQLLLIILSEGLTEESVRVLFEKSAPSWVILCNKAEEFKSFGWLHDLAEGHRTTVRLYTWHEFRARILRLDRTADYYMAAWEKYQAMEGGDDFLYIPPEAVSREEKLSVDLISHIDSFCISDKGGMAFILADYGEGKTCFCHNFVWSHRNSELKALPRIPLIFFLNECKAGSVEGFLQIRLKEDYGLSVTFEELQCLCQLGLFTIVVDAFDQMPDETKVRRVEEDCETLFKLAKEKGQIILTCRSQYFEKYLKPMLREESRPAESIIHLLELKGFGEKEVRAFLYKQPKLRDWLLAPGNEQTLNYVYKKPLILQIIKSNADHFHLLLENKLKERKPLLEFDIFDMAYGIWTQRNNFEGLITKKLRSDACRNIANRVRTYGMNTSLDFSEWFDRFASEQGVPSEIADAVKKDLMALQLLDQSRLRGEKGRLAFRFNIYLEFLIASFVLEEIRLHGLEKLEFIRNSPLTLETRQLIITQFDIDLHGESLKAIVEDTCFKNFRDAQYQGANSLSLLLDVVSDAGRPREEKEQWDRLLREVNFRHAVLREADCRGADLTDLNFSHADLEGADLSYACLANTKMENSILTDVRFHEHGGLITTAFLYHSEKGAQFLAGGTERGILLLWSDGFKKCHRHHLHREKITSLTVSSDGELIYTGSTDGAISVLQVSDPEMPQTSTLNIRGICCLELSPHGEYLVAGGQTGELLVRDLATKANKSCVLSKGHKNAWISAVSIEDSGVVLVAGNTQGELFLLKDWSYTLNLPKKMHSIGVGGVKNLIFIQSGLIIVLTDNNELGFYSLSENGLQKIRDSFKARAVSFSFGSNQLFWLDKDMFHYAYLGKMCKLERLGNSYCGGSGVVIASSDDGMTVAVGGDNLLVFQKDKESYHEVLRDDMHMNCRGFIFSYAKGLSFDQVLFFLIRGASWPPNEYFSEFLDLERVHIDRVRGTFACNICGEHLDWKDCSQVMRDRLKCRNVSCQGSMP